MAKAIEKISLGINEEAYRLAAEIDTKLFEAFTVLDAIVEKSIGGSVDDYQSLIASPIDHLSELYWAKYGDKFPSNSDKKQTFLSKSAFSASQILSITGSIQEAILKLRNHKPIIEGGIIKSGLVKDDFQILVHKNKVEAYKLIQSVLRTHKKLKDLRTIPQEFHLLRQYQPMLEMRGGMLKPSRKWFSQSK